MILTLLLVLLGLVIVVAPSVVATAWQWPARASAVPTRRAQRRVFWTSSQAAAW